MTARPRPRAHAVSPLLRLILLGGFAAIVAIFVVAALIGHRGGGANADAIQQLDAQIVVTSRSYQQHLASGDVPRQQQDREALRGDCDQARLLGLGSDTASQEIRTFCAGIGDAVP